MIMNNQGITLLITLVILSALIAAVTGVASIFIREIRISGAVDDSVIAIMAADAGIEKKLYDTRKLGGDPLTVFSAALSNGATYLTCPLPGSCTASPVQMTSTGTFNDAQRTLEVTF